jgi:hypothetical protein
VQFAKVVGARAIGTGSARNRDFVIGLGADDRIPAGRPPWWRARPASGSYFPPPVRAVEIPKRSGGSRVLGVPTVADRIAQTVVAAYLEPDWKDRRGYRDRPLPLCSASTCRARFSARAPTALPRAIRCSACPRAARTPSMRPLRRRRSRRSRKACATSRRRRYWSPAARRGRRCSIGAGFIARAGSRACRGSPKGPSRTPRSTARQRRPRPVGLDPPVGLPDGPLGDLKRLRLRLAHPAPPADGG